MSAELYERIARAQERNLKHTQAGFAYQRRQDDARRKKIQALQDAQARHQAKLN